MPTKRSAPVNAASLIPLPVDVDLIRFEKNLLQIGFFGANDARDKNRTSRRIEQVVFRNGHKVRVAAEFRGSEQLGLPSTTDRDKFIALLKIVGEERARTGHIANPIRFSGYRLIQELGLSRNGEIYEEILRWGKRMTDTTITSEQVIYFAAKKHYSDEVLHVFRSFRRTGTSNLKGGEKHENYEVVLEDWLVENLNQRYVIPEDFNAYKQLTRPTAKGIFGNLHLWFHASQGRPVEKDYADLCNLLNVQIYPHLSKIKSTMGLALDELVTIKYISKWDIQPMTTKKGYKIMLAPGSELLELLSNSRTERRDVPTSTVAVEYLSPAQEAAISSLLDHGVLPVKARDLVVANDPNKIVDIVDYLQSQISSGRRNNVENPAGLIIYSIEHNLPVPSKFLTGRRKKEINQAEQHELEQKRSLAKAEVAYLKWKDQKVGEGLAVRYSASELERKISEVVIQACRTDESFRRIPAPKRAEVALQIISKEVRSDLMLPTFEEWWAGQSQIPLF